LLDAAETKLVYLVPPQHTNESSMLPSQSVVVPRVKEKEADHSLLYQVKRVLLDTGYAALRRIDCRVEDGVVELSGDVPSFYCKQIAQTAVLALKHVRRVENCLRVA
jgi:osmotically-inducible protein OsmY